MIETENFGQSLVYYFIFYSDAELPPDCYRSNGKAAFIIKAGSVPDINSKVDLVHGFPGADLTFVAIDDNEVFLLFKLKG